MLELALVAVVAGFIWFRHSGKTVPSLPGGGLRIQSQNWFKPVLGIVAIVIAFFAWDWFKILFAEWFATSDIGEILNWSPEVMTKWLWVIPTTGAILYLVWRIPNKIWGSLVSAFIAVIAVVFITYSLMTGETMFSWIESTKPDRVNVRCTTQKELDDTWITPKGRPIVFCPEKGSLFAYVAPGRGTQMNITWEPKFVSDHPNETANYTLPEFISVRDGHVTSSIEISPVKADKRNRERSAFDQSGLSYVVMWIKAR